MPLVTIGREFFGEQGRVPDRIDSTRYVSGDGLDFMSGIEDLHSIVGRAEAACPG